MTEIQTVDGGQKDALLKRANIKKVHIWPKRVPKKLCRVLQYCADIFRPAQGQVEKHWYKETRIKIKLIALAKNCCT